MIFPLSGGQTGASLTVNSSGTGTITVSNTTLGKSYSKSVTAGGSVEFKGLQTGIWTVRLTDGTQTSTKTITITSDYSTSIAYFSASINITYPATSTCVVTDSSGQTVASNSNTGTSAKTWTATVNATGTYTVTATATDGSGKTKSQSVSIASDGQSVSVELSYRVDYYITGVKYIDIEPIKDSIGDYGTVTENANYVFIDSDGYSVAVGYISSESVDLSGATKLFCRITGLSKNNSDSDNGLRMSVCGTKTPYHNGNRSDLGVINISSAELDNGTYVLDVSQIASGYIGVYSYGAYINASTRHRASFNLVEFYSE